MNLFSINGMSCPTPIGHEESFESLMTYLHRSLVNENSLISSIRVNGSEVGPTEEADLAGKPLSAIESIEIVCVHPREIAEETLQTLKLLLPTLSDLSRRAAMLIDKGQSSDSEVRRLIDGLETLSDAVTSARTILRLGRLAVVDVLESDLLSILQDLFESQKKGDLRYRVELFRDHLPSNLADWGTTGIPEMIRARDS